MAELLKRQYDLMVLKTELGHWTGGPGAQSDEARFTLQYKLEGRLEDGRVWIFPVLAIAPKERLTSRNAIGPGPRFTLPIDLIQDLKDWFTFTVEGQKPLWVHLVKPYGVLRFVPWERILGEALRVPILMLPDFIFPPPREEISVLDVVICGSAPLGYESLEVQFELMRMADHIHHVEGRAVNLHVFTDKDIADNLNRYWTANGRLGENLKVYGHAAALPYVEADPSSRLYDKADSLRSPWLLWMRDALANRCVDVAHFVCHGYLSRENGAMLFAQSPLERTDRYLAGPVCATELVTFLTQVGAWSSVFTSLPGNHSEPGLRALADAIAQIRPGPMMMYSAHLDPSGEALAGAYDFLYSFERTEVPASPSLFIYCQPYLTFPSAARLLQTAASGPQPAPYYKPAPFYGGIPVPVKAVEFVMGHIEKAVDSLINIGTKVFTPKNASIKITPRPTASQAIQSVVNEDVLRNNLQKQALINSIATLPVARSATEKKTLTSLVSSTERFVEQVQLRYQQLARDEILESGDRGQEMQIVFDTMQKLRKAVADKNTRKPPESKVP